MSHSHINDRPFPRGALIGAAVLIGFVLAATAATRWGGLVTDTTAPPAATAVELSFVDRVQGGIAVMNAETGAEIAVLEPGQDGFIRGVMRGLVRQRKMAGIGAETPFRLTRAADGQLWLIDPTTEEQIYLGAFGPSNREAFARLLPQEGGKT